MNIRNWLLLLIPLVIIALAIGQSMTSDAAAVAVGAILGLLGIAAGAAVTAMVAEVRRYNAVQDSIDRRARVDADPPPPAIIEARWRPLDAGPAPEVTPPPPPLPARGDTIYLPAPRM